MKILPLLLIMIFGTVLLAQESEKNIDIDIDQETKKVIIIKKENGNEEVLKYDLEDEEAQKILKELEEEGLFDIEMEMDGHDAQKKNAGPASSRKRVIKRQRTIKRPAAKSDAYIGVIANPAETGTLIEDVIADSPAHKTGIQTGDVIVSMNGARLKDYRSINRLISYFEPNDVLELIILRDGKEKKMNLTLSKRKGAIH